MKRIPHNNGERFCYNGKNYTVAGFMLNNRYFPTLQHIDNPCYIAVMENETGALFNLLDCTAI